MVTKNNSQLFYVWYLSVDLYRKVEKTEKNVPEKKMLQKKRIKNPQMKKKQILKTFFSV